MKSTSLERVLTQKNVTRAEKVRLVLSLSLPAILAQLTTIAMQYIDAGMVGSLGAEATASSRGNSIYRAGFLHDVADRRELHRNFGRVLCADRTVDRRQARPRSGACPSARYKNGGGDRYFDQRSVLTGERLRAEVAGRRGSNPEKCLCVFSGLYAGGAVCAPSPAVERDDAEHRGHEDSEHTVGSRMFFGCCLFWMLS